MGRLRLILGHPWLRLLFLCRLHLPRSHTVRPRLQLQRSRSFSPQLPKLQDNRRPRRHSTARPRRQRRLVPRRCPPAETVVVTRGLRVAAGRVRVMGPETGVIAETPRRSQTLMRDGLRIAALLPRIRLPQGAVMMTRMTTETHLRQRAARKSRSRISRFPRSPKFQASNHGPMPLKTSWSAQATTRPTRSINGSRERWTPRFL